MSSPTLTAEKLAEKHGRRSGGQPLFEPFELGYRCPQGHKGECITWSEFNEHIWCFKCQLDYPSKDCPMQRPGWMKPEDFKRDISKFPFKAKVLPGVDHSVEMLDKRK